MRKKLSVLLLTLCCAILTACLPANYTKSQLDDFTEKGTEIITDYLNTNYSNYTLGRVSVVEGVLLNEDVYNNYERNLTNVVTAEYTVGFDTFKIYANIVSKEIYTSDFSFDINKITKECLLEEFKKIGLETEIYIDEVNVFTTIESIDIPTADASGLSTSTTIDSAIPSTINASNATDYIKASFGKNSYKIWAQVFTNIESNTLSEEAWSKIFENCPGIYGLSIFNTDKDTLIQSITENKTNPEMYINLMERYVLYPNQYKKMDYSIKNYNDIYILSPDTIYTRDNEGNIEDVSLETTFNEDEKYIVVATNNSGNSSYILFKGNTNYESSKIKLANTMVIEDKNPVEHSYRKYCNDFYTIDGMSGYHPYLFTGKIKIVK